VATTGVTAVTAQQVQAPDCWAIVDARVVPVSGPVLDKATVVLRGGLITDVGAAVKAPVDARIVDGAGLTVYPGLIDAYSVIEVESPKQQGNPPPPNRDRPAGVFPIREAIDLVSPDRYKAWREAGITSALVVPGNGVFRGRGAVINFAGDEPGEMLVRRDAAAVVAFEAQGSFSAFPGSLMGAVAVVRQSLLDAQHYKAEWARYGAVPRGHRRPRFNKALEALVPVVDRRTPVCFEASSDRAIRRAVRLGDELGLDYLIAGGLEAWKADAVLAARKVPVLATLNFPELEPGAELDPHEPLRDARLRDQAPGNAARLDRAGIRFAFQSGGLKDPKKYLRNAARAVEAGLPADRALRAMTLSAAELLGVADQLGSIESGKVANLTVTDGELFDKKTRVKMVFIDGRRFEPPAEAPRPAGGEAPALNLSGIWDLTITTPEGVRTATFSLTQSGGELAGTFASPELGSYTLASGSISGSGFTIQVTIVIQGAAVNATFTGTAGGDSMDGTVSLAGLGTVPFTGTRPKGD
jgi:imidazolonepropionase-like amidohydrolase